MKQFIVAILVLVMSMGLLAGTAFAADENEDDHIYIIRTDQEVEDMTVRGTVYIDDGVTLRTTGTVTFDGDVYVYGTWRNTGDITGEGTVYCAHYNSSLLPDGARGIFSNTHDTTRMGNNVSIRSNSDYLNDPIPDGQTWDPSTDPDPEAGTGNPDGEGVTINETNFPDATFRQYVSDECDTNGDGVLNESEIASVTRMSLSNMGINSLTGIEYFTSLESLDCSSNNLSELDVSKNTELAYLTCNINNLTELDVSQNTKLIALTCDRNDLKSLDLSNNSKIASVVCASCDLHELTINAPNLDEFNCEDNHLVKLDLSSAENYIPFLFLSTQTCDVTATQVGNSLRISLADLVGAENIKNITLKGNPSISIVGDEIVLTDKSIKEVTYTYETGASSMYNPTEMEVVLTIADIIPSGSTINGLHKDSDGVWRYYSDGVATNYTGFAENANGKWYVENGVVTFKTTGVIKDPIGVLGEPGAWYYVVDSKVQTGYTGVANHKNGNGWWYVVNGKVDFGANTVAKNNNGWWYVVGGKVQFGYTGVGNYKNSNGWWYIKDGKVDFSANTVAKNNNGWWYVEGGKVNFGYTGVSNYKNSNGWWYVKNGKVDFSFNGRAKNKNGTWNVVKGKVRF